MNLRDRDKYRDAAWDWSILNDCFAGRIRPTDIDGMVERKGHFLVLEAKPRGARMNEGQSHTFKALARQPNTTILILYGRVNEPEEMAALGSFEERQRQPCTLASVQSFVRRWFVHADTYRASSLGAPEVCTPALSAAGSTAQVGSGNPGLRPHLSEAK